MLCSVDFELPCNIHAREHIDTHTHTLGPDYLETQWAVFLIKMKYPEDHQKQYAFHSGSLSYHYISTTDTIS